MTTAIQTPVNRRLEKVAQLSCQMLGTAACDILVANSEKLEGADFEYIQVNLADRPALSDARLEKLAYRVMATGEGLNLAELKPHIPGQGSEAAGLVGSYLAIPLKVAGQSMGALAVADNRPRQWTAEETAKLEDIATLIVEMWQASVFAPSYPVAESDRTTMLESHSAGLLERREKTQRDVASGLHDDVLQGLIAVGYQLANDERQALTDAQRLTVETVRERRLELMRLVKTLKGHIQRLQPAGPKVIGLHEALKALVAPFEAPGLPEFDLYIEGSFEDLPQAVVEGIYETVKDALANVQSHAQAERLWVRLERQQDHLRLCIQDDGCGFDLPLHLSDWAGSGYYGLLGIEDRVRRLGGELSISSQPGKGSHLRCEIPLKLTKR